MLMTRRRRWESRRPQPRHQDREPLPRFPREAARQETQPVAPMAHPSDSPAPGTPGLTALSERHLAACRAAGRAKGTINLYRRVHQGLLAHLGSDDPAALNLMATREWAAWLQLQKLHPTTTKLYVSCAKVWASWLEAEG